MTLVDPKDHILKVSCHYLYFWLRYKDLLLFFQKTSLRYRGYRGKGGKQFDEDDDDDDDDDDVVVDVEGQNEGQSVLWESERILKVSCQYLYYWLRYRGYRGSGGKYFDDDDEEDDDDDDDDDDDVDDEGQNEEQSVLWESGLILKVSWQYLYYWPRYRGYRGGGGKHFDDDDDEDNDEVDREGKNEGESVLWESECILKFSCQYL